MCYQAVITGLRQQRVDRAKQDIRKVAHDMPT